MAELSSRVYTFDPRPDYPLQCTVKRHWDPASPHLVNPDAYTLILSHGTSFHKEQWEPALDDFYALVRDGHNRLPIRDAWVIECPNHGDSAELNEKALDWGYEVTFRWEEYAHMIHLFVHGLGRGVDIDFSKRKLIGVGHSMGAVAFIDAMSFFPKIKPERLVLIEPMILTKATNSGTQGRFFYNSAKNRRDIWPSKEDAYTGMKGRPAYKMWDDRVLRIYANHGLRPLPTSTYPDKHEGVTLKCTRQQELATYNDPQASSRIFDFLGHVVKRVPTHLIVGTIDNPALPLIVKDEVIRFAAGGAQNLVTIGHVERASHLVVQENPTGVARELYQALTTPLSATRFKL
ncbi:hypothetical protein FISHEDRAFT_65118 [Fistulina hepatica ATCC 64428]|uniref:AB hydrolase-1 domain-containing protein n=1 Tax=Fistulina hepatica ATCC 64428 TaxID=1128425 RepID=A0A0D7AH81_9AGAR|nr:hypothetical protein FISHEDRAFT_65118 [Fistulina hepatica ATCC 64428]